MLAKVHFLLLFLTVIGWPLYAQQTVAQYLSGTDKDHTVLWDFYCTKGYKSREWSEIPVPSNGGLQGFETYNYYKDTQNPDEQGLYRQQFSLQPLIGGKKVFIVFEGAMTDTELKINGNLARTTLKQAFPSGNIGFLNAISPIGTRFQEPKLLGPQSQKNMQLNYAPITGKLWFDFN